MAKFEYQSHVMKDSHDGTDETCAVCSFLHGDRSEYIMLQVIETLDGQLFKHAENAKRLVEGIPRIVARALKPSKS